MLFSAVIFKYVDKIFLFNCGLDNIKLNLDVQSKQGLGCEGVGAATGINLTSDKSLLQLVNFD